MVQHGCKTDICVITVAGCLSFAKLECGRIVAAKSRQLQAPCNGAITGCEIMSKLKCGIRNIKALPRMAKPLVLRHGRRITSARFSARLVSYSLFPTLLRCLKVDCSFAATPRPFESEQRYYSLPIMKLGAEMRKGRFLRFTSNVVKYEEPSLKSKSYFTTPILFIGHILNTALPSI